MWIDRRKNMIKERKIPITVTINANMVRRMDKYMVDHAPHLTRSTLVEYALLELFKERK